MVLCPTQNIPAPLEIFWPLKYPIAWWILKENKKNIVLNLVINVLSKLFIYEGKNLELIIV